MPENNDHTRVTTRGHSPEDSGKTLKTRLHIERRMGRNVEGESITILFGTQMLVGREKSCEIPILEDRISRKHALLKIDQDAVKLVDLGSTNGTTRNNEPVTEEIIVVGGDQICFGQAQTFETRIVERDGVITSVRLASGPDAYLLSPREFIIGFAGPEGDDVDLKIYDPSILPRHAYIEFFAGQIFIVSLDPAQPVIVNANPVRELEIRNNYLLELGNTMLRFEKVN